MTRPRQSDPAPEPDGPAAGDAGIADWGRGRWALVLLSVATVLGLITVLEAHARALTWDQDPAPLATSLKTWLPDYYIWAALTPAVAWLGRRFPLDRGVLGRSLSVHLGAGAAFVAVELAASAWVVSLLVAGSPPPDVGFWAWYARILARFFVWGLLIYWVILAGVHALRWFRKSREQELAASELEAKLAGAQLRALKMQLHPHFFFNTLHSIGVLVRKDERGSALEMLTGLGELLRSSLDNAERQVVSLREELEFVERYLEIEKIRFRDRLRVRFDVDPAVYDDPVPNLILQPLVENAVRHGVAPSVEPRTLEVAARRGDGQLVVRVEDDGPGLPDDWRLDESSGVGLSIVRSRLEKLYGDAGGLEIDSPPDGGVRAVVRVPSEPLVAEAVSDRAGGGRAGPGSAGRSAEPRPASAAGGGRR